MCFVVRIELATKQENAYFFDGCSETARGVAQSGSASALGAEGRWFESSLPDHKIKELQKTEGELSETVRVQRPSAKAQRAGRNGT